MNEILKVAYDEGILAAIDKSINCPYISGQRVLVAWQDGYVSAIEEIPEGLKGYLLGRCLYKLGTTFDTWDYQKYPAYRIEFSGFLAQKDKVKFDRI